MATNLAEHLRALPGEALGALLQLRPDLVVPVPADLSALAARAQSRGSVGRPFFSTWTALLSIACINTFLRGAKPCKLRDSSWRCGVSIAASE